MYFHPVNMKAASSSLHISMQPNWVQKGKIQRFIYSLATCKEERERERECKFWKQVLRPTKMRKTSLSALLQIRRFCARAKAKARVALRSSCPLGVMTTDGVPSKLTSGTSDMFGKRRTKGDYKKYGKLWISKTRLHSSPANSQPVLLHGFPNLAAMPGALQCPLWLHNLCGSPSVATSGGCHGPTKEATALQNGGLSTPKRHGTAQESRLPCKCHNVYKWIDAC